MSMFFDILLGPKSNNTSMYMSIMWTNKTRHIEEMIWREERMMMTMTWFDRLLSCFTSFLCLSLSHLTLFVSSWISLPLSPSFSCARLMIASLLSNNSIDDFKFQKISTRKTRAISSKNKINVFERTSIPHMNATIDIHDVYGFSFYS